MCVEKQLEQAIDDYLLEMISIGYAYESIRNHEQMLKRFMLFIKRRKLDWHDVFTWKTLKISQENIKSTYGEPIIGISQYLYRQQKISQPIHKPIILLSSIYEEYLDYYQKSRQVPDRRIKQIRRLLSAFNNYLEKIKTSLSTVSIEQIDAFFAEFNSGLAPETCKAYRSIIRGFLKYLYYERKILKTDLASLILCSHMFAMAKPPKFLRPHEVKRLLDSVDVSTPSGLRTYAMLQLACLLGLRPKEISQITLDDIEFSLGEISIKDRKNKNPVKLPLPEDVIKSIAAYIIGGRPKSKLRMLFLSPNAPFRPPTSNTVSTHLNSYIRRFNLEASVYWLRHTYAQNLLESGASIYEIKEMMGHDTIESTRKYLHINIKLMRKVLFDETL